MAFLAFDLVVVGGGLVGLGTALAVTAARPDLRVAVLEKEADVALHQSGHNSGVLHSGLYYQPGSLKARLCVRGKALLEAFCEERGAAFLMGRRVTAVVPDGAGLARHLMHD